MVERRKIGLIVPDSEIWTGGAYYLVNLIQALNQQPDQKKPQLIIFFRNPNDILLIRETGYPYLSFHNLQFKYNWAITLINRVGRKLWGQSVYERKYPESIAQLVFPSNDEATLSKINRKIYWIPDFQEHYLPQFFSPKEIQLKKKYQIKLAKAPNQIVFSSRNAERDFQTFYPENRCKTSIINFAVTHPQYDEEPIGEILNQYSISSPYFFSPNQFWAHKNHLVVLEAVKQLKESGYPCTVAFSGRENDYRNPHYFDSLKKYVNTHGLESYVRFLGFIDRRDQLTLMKQAVAVIQPSLFEGWSTVVEDAKAMNQYLLLSDLAVHREQINYNSAFFEPHRADQLATLMREAVSNGVQREKKDYAFYVRKFGKDFLSLLDE